MKVHVNKFGPGAQKKAASMEEWKQHYEALGEAFSQMKARKEELEDFLIKAGEAVVADPLKAREKLLELREMALMLLTTKGLSPEVKEAWITTLRSGEYKQYHGQLRSSEEQYCPLGTLADLAASGRVQLPVFEGASWVEDKNTGNYTLRLSTVGEERSRILGELEFGTGGKAHSASKEIARSGLLAGVRTREGVFGFDMRFSLVPGLSLEEQQELASLNDDEQLSFVEIADWIEEKL